MSEKNRPALEVYSHCGSDEGLLEWLRERAEAGLDRILAHPGTEEAILPALESVEVTLVSDEAIAEVHGEFLDDPTPTDVITFHHGEILISEETARREGPAHGKSAAEETLLYLVHGLLHLNGHVDASEPERSEMHRAQEEILFQILRSGAIRVRNIDQTS